MLVWGGRVNVGKKTGRKLVTKVSTKKTLMLLVVDADVS